MRGLEPGTAAFSRELDRHIEGFYETDNPLSPYYNGPEFDEDGTDPQMTREEWLESQEPEFYNDDPDPWQ
jgi:hypothetical protein